MMTEQQNSPEQVIDWSVALENTGGDESLLLELIGPFIEEANERLGHLRQALKEQDYVLLNRAAHTLKSLLRTFGASSIMVRAQELEDHFAELAADRRAIDKGTKAAGVITPERLAAAFADAPRMVSELEPQVQRVIAAVKARLGS
jgi:HPt (histidine-containing phosphotransfer) domain-containing protein